MIDGTERRGTMGRGGASERYQGGAGDVKCKEIRGGQREQKTTI